MAKNATILLASILCSYVCVCSAADPIGQRAELPIFMVGDTWVILGVERKVIEVTGDRVLINEKILTDRAGASLCGPGKPIKEMNGEYDNNLTLLKATSPSGQPITECDGWLTGFKFLDFPLYIGKQWKFTDKMTTTHDGQTDPHLDSFANEFTVEAMEEVTVPAGTFKAFKITQSQVRLDCSLESGSKPGTSHSRYRWYAPEAKRNVKGTDWSGSVQFELQKMQVQ